MAQKKETPRDGAGRTKKEQLAVIGKHLNRRIAGDATTMDYAISNEADAFLNAIDLCGHALRSISYGESECDFGSLSSEQSDNVIALWNVAIVDLAASRVFTKAAVLSAAPFARVGKRGEDIRNAMLAGTDSPATRAIAVALVAPEHVLAVSQSMSGVDAFVQRMAKATRATGEMRETDDGSLVPIRERIFGDKIVREARRRMYVAFDAAVNGGAPFNPTAFVADLSELTGVPMSVATNRKTGVWNVRLTAPKAVEAGATLRPIERLRLWAIGHNATLLPDFAPGVSFVSNLLDDATREAAIAEATAIGFATETTAAGDVKVSGYQIPTPKATLVKAVDVAATEG